MPGISPASEYVVEVLPEFGTIVDQVVPPSVDLSILYPVIAEPPLVDLSILYPVMTDPPLSLGAVQLRLICEEVAAVAVSPVGGDGTTARVVADTVLDGELVPTELMADTR